MYFPGAASWAAAWKIMQEFDVELPADQNTIAVRAANEGVPVAAIGRILNAPFSLISETLKTALGSGRIASVPKADWPPSVSWNDRIPTMPRSANPDDVEFACGQVLRLTRLEAGLLMVLLRCDSADKARLHAVVEQQRASRQSRPSNADATDPKIVDVMICKLRSKLRKHDPEFIIQTNWGRGYFIDPATKQKIYRMVNGLN